jgi:competence protein ComEC
VNQRLAILAGIFLSLLSCAFGQGNGKLQIHFVDVGQGDSAVLISPSGQVVLFDVGKDLKVKSCDKPLAYLDQLGVKHIDFMFVSHYHFDHIGCVPDVLGQFPMQGDVYDRVRVTQEQPLITTFRLLPDIGRPAFQSQR